MAKVSDLDVKFEQLKKEISENKQEFLDKIFYNAKDSEEMLKMLHKNDSIDLDEIPEIIGSFDKVEYKEIDLK